jgi:mannose-1-phosphate guanylyltransferase
VQALILAGGEGTRLRPLTSTVPKPVLTLANRPFISYMVDWLGAHGVDEIVLSCGFLADELRAVLGNGEWDGARLRYVEEKEPLGTAGAVKYAEELLEERFMVLNGDILADFDLSALQRFHAEREATGTIALIPVEDPSAYGLVRTADDGRITEFLEKPSREQLDTNLINAGAYVLERRVLEAIPAGRAVSFEREVFPSLIGSGLYALAVDGYWLDIGTPARYLEGTRDILERRVRTVVGDSLDNGGLSVGGRVVTDPESQLVGPALVGEECQIHFNARVGPIAVLGNECRIGEGAVVENSVLHRSVIVDESAVIRDSIVADGVRIGANSRIEGGTVIGAAADIGPSSQLVGERVEAQALLS